MIDRAARRAAKTRHPSSRPWRPDLRRLTERVARTYAAEGRPHPTVAAAVQSARGVAGETTDEFASRLGLPAAWLARIEAGGVSPRHVPTAITAATPWVDWAALRDAEPPADPPARPD